MFYAYYIEEEKKYGIVKTWNECQALTKGKNARYKKFENKNDATSWLESGALYTPKSKETSQLHKDATYFDSGTGRTGTVEVKVCDVYGDSLLPFIMPKDKINRYGNYFLSENRTNNFGELTALFIALKYSIKYNIKKICGDSKLIIDFWSIGRYNEEKIDKDTIDLIEKVVKLRKEFEKIGGEILHVSGDINPADLGFHK
ncbi:ribonuclease H family protein [Streptobacillus felis]|uniref:Viroplasmin family protein n=1 Tax=Streptobacillus felis TaxID=1384509 RepID=A0A7Z0T890_9FUSO|nr:ribonuclease H family protein [Streptobacillus felis]NYV27694.1 viroplasmin family protein [Streptobacillus felis]